MLIYENYPDRKEEIIPLQQFISTLLDGFQPSATLNNSFVINDVSNEMFVKTDPILLATVMNRILSTVIARCSNSCIRLTAKCFHNVVLFRINHSFINDLGINDLKDAEAFAATLGGCISLNSQARKGNAIILSFLSLPEAA